MTDTLKEAPSASVQPLQTIASIMARIAREGAGLNGGQSAPTGNLNAVASVLGADTYDMYKKYGVGT